MIDRHKNTDGIDRWQEDTEEGISVLLQNMCVFKVSLKGEPFVF